MNKSLQSVTKTVLQTFANFAINMEVVKSYEGYNYYHIFLVPTHPVRMHILRDFIDDLRYELETYVVHIEAPVKFKREIQIKVMKSNMAKHLPWSVLQAETDLDETDQPLAVPLGMNEENIPVILDIQNLPHLLIGGRSHAGKSNTLHCIINTLLLRHSPDKLCFILVDSKRHSLLQYKGVPHLLTDPVTTTAKALPALTWVCREIDRRFTILEAENLTNIKEYHQQYPVATDDIEPLPYMVVMIDEIADIMSEYGNKAEKLLSQIAMWGKAVGVHLILTTSSDEPRILRGTMCAYFTSRLCFGVNSQFASELITHDVGAEQIFGSGVALLSTLDIHPAAELQTASITDSDIKSTIALVCERDKVSESEYFAPDDGYVLSLLLDDEDELYEEAKLLIIETQTASTAFLQRKLRIGYSRAARLLDTLEERGVVGPQNGIGPREIL